LGCLLRHAYLAEVDRCSRVFVRRPDVPRGGGHEDDAIGTVFVKYGSGSNHRLLRCSPLARLRVPFAKVVAGFSRRVLGGPRAAIDLSFSSAV
jgi:hypothetical protein